MKIYIYTDNFDIAYVATSGFKINVNEVGLVIPQNAVSNMTDGVINYRIEGYLNGDLRIEQRQSNYYLKTPSFEMQDTNIVAVSTEFVDGGDYKMIINASEYNADGLSQVEIDATTFAEEKYEEGKQVQKSLLESITITSNGTYENENGYSTIEVNVEGGGDINPDTLREITITENGVYTSKYSSPIEGKITGIFDDGTPFYGYGELNGIIYNTQYTPQQNENGLVFEKVEFWYKGDNIVVGDGWNVILSSAPTDDSIDTIEFRYYEDNNRYLSLRVDGMSDYQLGTFHEGSWYHFLLYMENGNVILKVNDQEVLNVPKAAYTQYNPVPFYINGAYYDANGDGWEGNRNANGCFGMIKIDDQTFIPTENGFINYNTQEPLPVVKVGDYNYNTTDVILEGEPYKTINVDVQPNLARLDATLTQNGSYNLDVEDGVDGYNSGTIVVDVPSKVSPITITENGTYYPQDETIKFLIFDGDDVFDLGQGFFIEDVANMVLLTINFKWVGDETGEPMNICGVENSDWDSESCFAIRYYDGNFSAKVGSFEMNFPADYEWHHMEIAYRSGLGYIVFDGSLYQEELGNFNKPTGNIYVGATNTGGEIFRPFSGYISDVVISGNIDRISYTPIDNGFRGNNGEEITDNIGGGYCDLDEEPIPNTAPIGYNEIHVNVPQEGGGCNLEPLWVTPYWENRDESNYVHYNPSEGMNGFDSAHIDLYPVHEDGKQEAINGLGHLVVTESGSYTAQKETKTRKYVHLDGDDYFEINAFLSHTNKIEFELMRYDIERRMILGNPTCYFAFDYPGLVANYRGKYTNPIPVENMKWVKVTMTTDYGLEVISEYGKKSEPWQGDFIYPNIEDNFTIGKGFGDYENNFGGNISTIEIHDSGNNIEVVEPWQDGFYQGVFIIGETIYENQGGGTATYSEESYDIGVDGWKSVEVNIEGGDCEEAYEQGKTDQKDLMTTATFTSNGTYTRENGWNEVKVNVFWFSPFMEKTILYKFQQEWDRSEVEGYEWAGKMYEYEQNNPNVTSNGMMYEIDFYSSVYFYNWKIINLRGGYIPIWGKKSLVTPWVYNANNSPSTTKVLPDYFLGGFDCTEVEYIDRVFEGAETIKAFLSLKNLGKSFTSVNTLDLSVLTNLNKDYYDGDCFEIIADSVYDFNVMNVNGISYSNVKLPINISQTAIDAWTAKGWVVMQ